MERPTTAANSIVHLIKRGARGTEIVRDMQDRERFLDAIYYLNDEYQNENWVAQTSGFSRFTRPTHWPDRKPLVDILGWTLLDNHLHMLIRIREDREKGLPEFAQRLFRSMTGHFNEKYGERGSIFQGPYKISVIDSDEYLRYVIPYILLKNTIQMHPQGLAVATHDFEVAWEWAMQYPFSSLKYHRQKREPGSRILAARNIIDELFSTERDLKQASRDMLEAYMERRQDLRALQLED